MEFFLPSVFAMMLAFFVSSYFFVRGSSLITLGILALLLIIFTAYNHYSLFANEYRIMTWADTAKQNAPTILVALVIVMMIGYLLFASGIKSSSLNMPPNRLPSEQSATNSLTGMINRGLVATGSATRNSPPEYEELQRARNQGANISALNRAL